jgi:hypothetical protein
MSFVRSVVLSLSLMGSAVAATACASAAAPAPASAPPPKAPPSSSADQPPPFSAEARARIDAKLRPLDESIATARDAIARDSGDPSDKEWVKRQLKAMVDIDQRIRKSFSQAPAGEDVVAQRYYVNQVAMRMLAQDPINTRALQAMLAVHGWITISAFGEEAEHDAWLLVQHANPDFQREILGRLEKLLPSGETSPKSFAYLYDRVAMHEHRPQRYGTQWHCVAVGHAEPVPIEDAEHVDDRRKTVGLDRIEGYGASISKGCTAAMPR